MSSKYYVFAAWQEFDKDAQAHIIKASTPFSAAVAYAIREWGLYHAAEGLYAVYDSAGNSKGTHFIPGWVDDSFGEALKEAFHVEVLVERNEGGDQDQDCEPGCCAISASEEPTVVQEDPSALTADHIEFAAYSDGSVVLQGVGYFDFYGGLDDDATPAIDRGFRERHGLRRPKGNKFETCYMQADQAIEALRADGAVHDQGLQAFIDA